MKINAYISILESAITRHQGLWGLIRYCLHVLVKEGPKGIGSRTQLFSTLNSPIQITAEQEPNKILLKKDTPKSNKNSHATKTRSNCRKYRSMPEIDAGLLPGSVLIGHPYGILGMGEVLRSAASALDTTGTPFSIRNTFGDFGIQDAHMHTEFPFMNKITQKAVYSTNIFCLNADEMQSALPYLGEDFFKGRYNIGCWAWELSEFPDEWCYAFRMVNEIWAMSRFTQQAIAEKADCPVVWMPLAVEFNGTTRLSRKYFGLPNDKFLFLFFFDFRSYIERKNPYAVMHAFEKAFGKDPSREKACLVIKINGKDGHDEKVASFKKVLKDFPGDTILIDKVMNDVEIRELIRNCDAFVSLHRSEGFGRGLAEAMYLEKPVITTGYSGNLDFTNNMNACLVDYVLIPVKKGEYPYGEGQVWADPDIDQAAWYMRRLFTEAAFARHLGKAGKNFIRTYHSFEAIGTRIQKRLEKLKLL
jgi:glycosyltransferase involved in cell wall biosynthesis